MRPLCGLKHLLRFPYRIRATPGGEPIRRLDEAVEIPTVLLRLILDGTIVKVRLDRKATAISLLVVLGVRRDGQKVLLSVANMSGESEAAWRKVLDDLTARGLRQPELALVDGAPGLEKALVALWNGLAVQRCTVHKLRNLVAHAPKKLAEEIAADYSDMIYAADAKTVAKRRKAFLIKWRDKCDRAPASRVQATDQDAVRTALGGNSGDVVLGAARLGPNHAAQGGWLGVPCRALRGAH